MKKVQTFFDPDTWTLTHLLYDQTTKDAVLIDPVLNYEPNGSTYGQSSINEVCSWIQTENLTLHCIIDTHAHADHVSGAFFLKKRFPDALYIIGNGIKEVQESFKEIFNLSKLATDGRQFDLLINEGQKIQAGSITLAAIATPGHTPACTSYWAQDDDMIFVGDALFMPDFGTPRCDFPKGDAQTLYHSIHEKLYKLPDETKVFVGHDYMPNDRELQWQTTIGASKKDNIHLHQETTQDAFVAFRQKRDKTLSPPRLLLPSIQINVDGGRLPQPEDNGISYIKLPLTASDQ